MLGILESNGKRSLERERRRNHNPWKYSNHKLIGLEGKNKTDKADRGQEEELEEAAPMVNNQAVLSELRTGSNSRVSVLLERIVQLIQVPLLLSVHLHNKLGSNILPNLVDLLLSVHKAMETEDPQLAEDLVVLRANLKDRDMYILSHHPMEDLKHQHKSSRISHHYKLR